MDLVIAKNDLLRIVGRAVGVAEKKSAMPALANVLLSTEDKALRVSSTDLYMAVTSAAPCDVNTPGSVAVPAKDFFERVKMMPAGPIQILVNAASQATLKAVGSARRYTLHGIPGSEFPVLHKPAHDALTLALPLDVFAMLLARTHFAISTDETRPHVNSALLEWSGDRVRMASTDGHRLARMDVTVAGTSERQTMLVPLKAVHELRHLVDEALGAKDATTVSIAQSGSNAFFEIAGVQFSTKLVDAQFPPIDQVIPQTAPQSIRAPRAALVDALRAVKIAAADRSVGGVKLALGPSVLRITSESPESGNGFDELAVDYSGPEVAIGFNAQYVLDALGVIDGDEVVIGVDGELDPAVIRPASETAGHSFVAVCMPMRI